MMLLILLTMSMTMTMSMTVANLGVTVPQLCSNSAICCIKLAKVSPPSPPALPSRYALLHLFLAQFAQAEALCTRAIALSRDKPKVTRYSNYNPKPQQFLISLLHPRLHIPQYR